ncbi:STAS-like domain-containing protein [Hymenobacter sp. GOD-10R]|uniref:STAS-like domain-containing protein n=1 Tax=Hymenobacter sp. GOD-10R TaxID=3093922 RepID=UPI002D792D1D|nr:STAS-like domain-containing protein [Hymenobacter sp. GOD-10R]WRQ28120.1 STAS-like domain-containing protein [Hymenobacter sp. GOD-10R]
MNATRIIAKDILGKSIAVMDGDGRKLSEEMTRVYHQFGAVVVSFKGISHITTAFLNAALGKFILQAGSPEEAQERASHVEFTDLANSSMETQIKRVKKLALDTELRSMHNSVLLQETCA